jgi:nitrite reductase/ring-hydroxylating ferredoxin subunit
MAEPQFVTVAHSEDLPPGALMQVKAGEEEIAIAHIGDRICAVQGHCLHLQGPLGEGKLDGNYIRCPWHGWTYDACTGLNDFDHAIQLRTYEVRVEDGEIQVAV